MRMDTYWNVPCLFLRQWGQQSKHLTKVLKVVSLCLSPLSLTQNSNNFVHSTNNSWYKYIVTGVTHFENTMMYSMQWMMLINTEWCHFFQIFKKKLSIHGLNQKHSTTKKTGVHQVYRRNSAPISHNHFMVCRHIFQQNVLYQNYILSLSQYHKLNHSITFSFFQKYACWNMTLKMDLKLWIWSRHKQLVLYPIVHMVLVFFLQSRFLCSSLAPIHYIGLTSMKVLIACLLCAFITHPGQQSL